MSEELFNPKGVEAQSYRTLSNREVYDIIANELNIKNNVVRKIVGIVFRGWVGRYAKKGYVINIEGVGTYIPTRRLKRHLRRKPAAKMIIRRLKNKKRKSDTKRW